MSDRPSHNLGGLDIDLARRIDEVCRRFEADWRAGTPTAHRGLSGRRRPTRADPHCGPNWRPWSASCARRMRRSRAPRLALPRLPSPRRPRSVHDRRGADHRPGPPPTSPSRRGALLGPRGGHRAAEQPAGSPHDQPTAAVLGQVHRPHPARPNPPASATSATTRSSARSPAAAWASCSRPGR